MNAKAETLQDRFLTGSMDTALWQDSLNWDGSSFPNTPTFSFGKFSVSQNDVAGLGSVSAFDLTGSAFSAELLYIDDPSQTGAEISVSDGTSVIYFQVNASTLYAAYWDVSTVVCGSMTYDPAVHRFLRISEVAKKLYFDYSADGTEWVNLAQRVADPFDQANVKLYVSVGATPHGTGVGGEWTNVGLVPVSSRLADPGFASR